MSKRITDLFGNGFPTDISKKILNKFTLYELQETFGEVLKEDSEYLKFRALELYGVEGLKSDYISTYEKYLQIAAFGGEIGIGSDKHVPEEKCFLYTAKSGNLELLEHYLDSFNMDFSLQLLQMNNLALIKFLVDKGKILNIEYSRVVKPEIYSWLMKLPKETLINFQSDSEFIGALMPIKVMKKLKEYRPSEADVFTQLGSEDNVFGLKSVIIQASISTLDYDRYKSVVTLLEEDEDPLMKYYMEDNPDIPEGLKDKLEPTFLLFLGCPNIIKAYGINGNITESEFIFVPEVSKGHALDMYNLLKKLNAESVNVNIKQALEWWSWIAKGRSFFKDPKDPDFDEIYYDLIRYVYRSGNIKLMKNWIRFFEFVEEKVDLVNFPELYSTVLENLTFTSSDTTTILNITIGVRIGAIVDILKNYYTPEFYLKLFDGLWKADQIKLLPTAEIAKLLKSKLDFFPKNKRTRRALKISIPKFMEPLNWYNKNIKPEDQPSK